MNFSAAGRRVPCSVIDIQRALLLARIYEAFPLLCPKCGSEMRIIAFITEAVVVRDILPDIRGQAMKPAMSPSCPFQPDDTWKCNDGLTPVKRPDSCLIVRRPSSDRESVD